MFLRTMNRSNRNGGKRLEICYAFDDLDLFTINQLLIVVTKSNYDV